MEETRGYRRERSRWNASRLRRSQAKRLAVTGGRCMAHRRATQHNNNTTNVTYLGDVTMKTNHLRFGSARLLDAMRYIT